MACLVIGRKLAACQGAVAIELHKVNENVANRRISVVSEISPRSSEFSSCSVHSQGQPLFRQRRVGSRINAANALKEQANSAPDVECDICRGTGWLICDFCSGQKTNVKAKTGNKTFRRCPSCRAAGVLICPKCKVLKCVTFPDAPDGELPTEL